MSQWVGSEQVQRLILLQSRAFVGWSPASSSEAEKAQF